MPDKYASFSALHSCEPKGSYKIEARPMGTSVALIAPHAGRIERGTSEICRSVAGDELTYYLFEGCKRRNNNELHITSSRFDEPQGLAVAKSAQMVVTFHGQSGPQLFINVGGLASGLGQIVIRLFSEVGYTASRQVEGTCRGLERDNICNRGRANQGLQLEISRGLRDKLVSDKDEMDQFCRVLRTAFRQYGL
jgi:phage replication-related protein YjqB (UPF0714/DUF867 family)